jgi:hypothetical protein
MEVSGVYTAMDVVAILAGLAVVELVSVPVAVREPWTEVVNWAIAVALKVAKRN